MEQKNKSLLSYAGILNILEGAVFCVYKPAAIYGLIIMAIGVYFMAVSKKTMEEQDDQRILLIVVAIINIPIIETAPARSTIFSLLVYFTSVLYWMSSFVISENFEPSKL